MDIKKIKKLASNGALGQLNIKKAQVGSNGYGFVFFDFHDTDIDPVFRKWSGKVCGAGAHFGNFERYMELDDVKFEKLSDAGGLGGLLDNDLHDLLLAGSLKTLLPDIVFGGDEQLFDALMFVITPDSLFFPSNFYYGASGTSLGGWDSEGYKRFPRVTCEEFNFSPFDFDKDGLAGLIEAHMFALKKVPVSDFCGIYGHDSGNALMCVHNGVPLIVELGYDSEYGEDEAKIVLDNYGYDFERDKFNFREMVKKAKKKKIKNLSILL